MANFLTTINCQQIPSLIFSPNTKTRFQTRTRAITSFPQSSSSFLSNRYSWNDKEKKNRGFVVVTRAGPPSNTSLIFAFVFPLTLLLATIFTSIRIADKLDEDYLEELAINQAIMEGEEEEDGDSSTTLTDEKPAVPTWAQGKPKNVPRIRNRPKREAEV
ncbi:hypothetical protein IFM89_013933 [Coptis chinensis]|uniref:High chlorophyll fluorescence 153 n=1 Tax=Coptis chinensis TaxID=261450 RepID=A0A835HAR2_9MAGN|nr:hypothetical protein IFM89_013933 [Coptis chinensis]